MHVLYRPKQLTIKMAACILHTTKYALFAALLLSTTLVLAGWETRAAVERLVELKDANELKTILDGAMSGQGSITWRSQGPGVEQQWLVRWDNRHAPRDVFRNGFVPRVSFSHAYQQNELQALDLRTYVASNTDSIFVSTAQRRPDGRFWTPRATANNYRYDIFAPGGIDVNPTLGHHKYENQNELAFPGGIHTRYIFGAVQFDEHRRQYRYHLNPNYEGAPPHRPRYCPIPHVFYTNLPPANQQLREVSYSSVKKRSPDNNHNELMRTDGELEYTDKTCSYCYELSTHIAFKQPNEIGNIEPYGHIDAYITKPPSAVIWFVKYYDVPSVQQGALQTGKCALLQADRQHNLNICFEGDVKEYDTPSSSGDLSSFPLCKDIRSSSKSYHATTKGKDGSVTIGFTVEPCSDCHNDANNCCH